MINIAITGAGTSLSDSILEGLEGSEDNYRLTLIDGLSAAGEARRFGGRTLKVHLDSETDISAFNYVVDLNQSYTGIGQVYRPGSSLVSLGKHLFAEVPSGSILCVHGSVREPAIIQCGGVESLAGQVTQLFNGRDPEPSPFGGTLAFNARTMDEKDLEQELQSVSGFESADIALERLQGDSFYTVVASLWIQASPNVCEHILKLSTDELVVGLGIAPDTGRNEASSPVRVLTKALRNDWVYAFITADLERTVWTQEAVNMIRGWTEV